MALNTIKEETIKDVIEERSDELVKLFNRKPKKAVEAFMEICSSNEEEAAKEIADFLISYKDNLDLEVVGDFLGTESEKHFQSIKAKKTNKDAPELSGINELVRQNFAEKFNFEGMGIVAGMRDFLSSFKLPGEGQKIGRIVESFSQQYHKTHSTDYHNKDAVEVLAFANIMLNTDLHNTSIADEKKMTYEQFAKNLKGVNGGADFNGTALQAIYAQIKEKPFELTFVREAVGITLEAAGPNGEDLVSKLNSTNAQEFLRTSLNDEACKIDIKTPSSWLKSITGFTTDINIEGPNGNIHIQAYKPGWFSRKEPAIIVSPLDSDEKSLELSAKISASFNCPIRSIKSTFDYERDEIIQTMSETFQAMGKKSHTLEIISKSANKTISRGV